ncbi:MAG: UDP-N-acetylmuramoyl-tripeptide--D-alanyl-D-alanine ligase [Rickettsiales bacterium]
MKTLWTSSEVNALFPGNATAPWKAERIVIDSRKIEPGDLFVAIKGERHDGHAFLETSLKQGAVAAVVSTNSGANIPQVNVADTMRALETLGIAARKRTRAKVVGVTGSVGKTSCKEALRLALGAVGSVYATEGNLNNHIGVPLTLANLPPFVDYAVIEMGMNHAGEITPLSKMSAPDAAIITTVEAVHLEFFDSVDSIADAKSEISAGLDKMGTLILPRDNPHFERMRNTAKTKYGITKIVTFGEHPEADYRLSDYQPEDTGSMLEAILHGTPVRFRIGAVGRHWGVLMMGVLAAVEALGADLPQAMLALENFKEQKGRGAAEIFSFRSGNVLLVDDSYNASPASMKAAFARMKEIGKARRKVAVLGDMLELGDSSAQLHQGLKRDLAENAIDLVFAAGSYMKNLYDALPENMRGAYAEKADMILKPLMAALEPGDIVLVKGSHGSGMYKLAEAMQEALRASAATREHDHAV